MKKTLALVLALAMVFSTITVAFAEDTLGEDAQVCADLGMLQGETGTVDAAYVATAPTRLQAAVMFLRLKGLEAEALAFTGEDNFADGEIAWAEGANLIAYLKANPQLGWIGDGTSFNPTGVMTAQAYYKVMLEALGYKQTTAEVAGDFAWEEVFTFAASVGLSKVADVESFTVNDLAVATVEALKVNVKDTEKTLAATLVEAGVVDEAKAVAAGLVEDVPAAPAVAVDEAIAVGNAAVNVTFEDDVDASAANVANYSIEGLEILDAAVVNSDTIRLTTAAMTSGKIYKLTVGEKTVQFTGVKKVSGGPEIKDAVSEDVEEVVIEFNKNIDLATGSDVANYSIAGIEIVNAEVDENEVILTTEGLKNKTKYTVKVTNVKSVDGVSKKSDSDSFTVKYDLTAPKISGDVEVQTNQRIVVNFTEKIDKETAEDLANYSIKVDETDGAELEIVSVTWDDDDENNVEIVTEPMEKREEYKLSVNNIADQRKVPNVITKPTTKKFKGIAEDETAPTIGDVRVLSPTTILVTYKDASKLDEESCLDLNNYELEDLDIESIETFKNKWKEFKALLTVEEMETGKSYKLTITDILDEFGNAMKEKSQTVRGSATAFAAAYVDDVIAVDKDKVYVVFSDEVDEDTAEDISNYNIDEGIGAPTEAVYKGVDIDGNKKIEGLENYVVTLTVNDLVNGYENAYDTKHWKYDLVVDGVQDLAGNEIYHKMKVKTNAKWDTTAPELEDVDVVDRKVIALAFDEKVKYESNAKLVLWSALLKDSEGNITGGTPITLSAMDYAEDFTVVEFSADTSPGSTDTPLVPGAAYAVYQIVYGGVDGGVKDLIGNQLAAFDINDFEFDAIADLPDGPEVDDYDQINAMTFEVTFTKWVKLTSSTVNTKDNKYTFNVSVDADDKDVVIFKLVPSSTIKILGEDLEYKFDLSTFVTDYHGTLAVNDDTTNKVTILDGEYTDDEAPYIDEVVAKNRYTVKITFSEEIPVGAAKKSDFELKNIDLDKAIEDFTVGDDDGDNIIELTVPANKAFESRYEYELILKAEKVKDYAGKLNKEKEYFYFDGTNLEK